MDEPAPPRLGLSVNTTKSLRDDVIVGVIGGLVAAPLCDASWHAIVTEAEYARGIVGLLVGLPVGIGALTFHWWKGKLDWLRRAAIYWWPIALVLTFTYVAGPEIYHRALEPAKAPETLRLQLNTITQERDRLRQQLAEAGKALPATIPKLGPQKALSIAQALGNPNTIPTDIRWAVFITYPPENRELFSVLIALMRNRLNPWILDAPDSSIDLDAPKFPTAPTDPGIIFHGDNVLNSQLSMLLGPCFLVRRTSREIDGLREWFDSRLSEPERNENRQITWIEIGHGSPWGQGNLGDCLQ
jgi:hypothetical protein